MNPLTRLVGFSVLLLLLFLAAALGAQAWLRGQTRRLNNEAIEAHRAQFQAVLRAFPRAPGDWDDGYVRQLNPIIGGTVSVFHGGPPPAPGDPATLYFDHLFETTPAAGEGARIAFAVPPTNQLLALHQRVAVGLALLAGGLLCLLMLLALLGRPVAADRGTRSPWTAAKAEMSGLAHLAKASVAQGQELDRERDVRRRAEEDAAFQQRLLAIALAEKIRLGRDLHDGIIQSLYAVGLTLESVRAVAQADPAEADRRLARCLDSLNGTIRDVRTYITGLAPENLRRAGFAQALEAFAAEMRAGRDVAFDLRIDEEATALLSDEQSANALQIVREAISNSLRHGRATSVTVRLEQTDREVCLLVQDNGAGFDPSLRTEGRGLGNMRARTEQIGAAVRVESEAGAGTRIVVTLPIMQPSS